jgi:glycosyltransferase involved in cell wall biosynthesis
MKQELEELGFQNVVLMPNCKPLVLLTPTELPKVDSEPFRLCTFSRVMREKGIDDAVEAIRAVNAYFGRTVYMLDIYGQVDPAQTDWFAELQKTFPSEIRYCGIISYDQSADALRDSFALLFPTEFFTEGVPGTIIDAYAVGVPVIASRWESFADVVEDGVTGIGYPFQEHEILKQILTELVRCPEKMTQMRLNCLRKAHEYQPSRVMNILLDKLK